MRVLPRDKAPDITTPLAADKDPFEGDLMKRRPLADALMTFFQNVEDPMVLALDGAWGTGKSTFVKMLIAAMKQKTKGDAEPFVVGYIDAFALDYVDDPFIPITHKIREIIKDNQGLSDKLDEYAKGAIKVLSKVLVGIGSQVVNFATQGALASYTKELGEKGIEGLAEKIGNLSEEFLSERMKSFQEDEQALSKFRLALGELATGVRERTKKPMVIFIDELDRCRPSFAVSFIERVKHFFSVDNVIFVLVMQRGQVESSLRACYGQDLKADEYLQKFVNFWVSMPLVRGLDTHSSNYWNFIESRFEEYELKVNDRGSDYFIEQMTEISIRLRLTLRQVDLWVSYFTLAVSFNTGKESLWFERLLLIIALLKMQTELDIYHDSIVKGEFPDHIKYRSSSTIFAVVADFWLEENCSLFGTINETSPHLYLDRYPRGSNWARIVPDLRMRFEFFKP